MNLKEYQIAARSTAVYLDKPGSNMIYPALGLIGECGEVAEKTKKLIRDDDWNMTDDRKAAIAKELGDCMWYCANICCDTNHDIQMIHGMCGYSTIQKIKGLHLLQIVLHINRYANFVAYSLEKWHYQDQCNLTMARNHIGLPNDLSHVLTCIEELARRLGFTLEDIYTANINNLLGRKKRGTIHGDGDNR